MHKKRTTTTVEEHYYYGLTLEPTLLLKLLEHATTYTDDAWLHLIVERAQAIADGECLTMADYATLVQPVATAEANTATATTTA